MFVEILLYIAASVISALAIIVLAKIVLQKTIRRPADYYEKENEKEGKVLDDDGFIVP